VYSETGVVAAIDIDQKDAIQGPSSGSGSKSQNVMPELGREAVGAGLGMAWIRNRHDRVFRADSSKSRKRAADNLAKKERGMKCIFKDLIPWILLLVLSAPPLEATATERSDEAILREIKEVHWPRAYREGDVALLDRILASEFQMIDAAGEWSDKTAELDDISKNRPTYRSFRFEIKRLEIFENGTAVIAGRGVVIAAEGDEFGDFEYQSSNILIKRDGRWQAIASHVSGVKQLKASG
jgi:hypothetical protein